MDDFQPLEEDLIINIGASKTSRLFSFYQIKKIKNQKVLTKTIFPSVSFKYIFIPFLALLVLVYSHPLYHDIALKFTLSENGIKRIQKSSSGEMI